MHTQRTALRSLLSVALVATVALAACGGSDDGVDEAQDGAPAESSPAGSDETPDAEPTEDAAPASDLGGAQACLESAGLTIAVGDEASTGLTPEMMENFGIAQILVFDDGAGTLGTIEAYASQTQADLAAEGYAGSPLGYQVGSAGDVVFKTTGAADVLDQIDGCL